MHGAVGGLLTPFENFAWSSNSDDAIIIASNDDNFIDSSPSIVNELIMDSSSNQPFFLEEAAKSMDAVGVEGIELFEINEAVESIVEDCADQIL